MRKMSPEGSKVKRDWEVLDWFASGGALSQGLRSVYFNYKCVQQKKRDTHTQLCTDVCNTYAQRIMSITKAEITHRNILYKFFHLKHIYPVHLMAKCVPWAGRQRERREREREKKTIWISTCGHCPQWASPGMPSLAYLLPLPLSHCVRGAHVNLSNWMQRQTLETQAGQTDAHSSTSLWPPAAFFC